MLDRAHSLAAILERMVVLYDRCLQIVDRERRTLVTMEFERLMESIREKDEVLSAIRGLDRDRLRIQDEFAIVMEVSSESLTLRGLAENLISQGGDAAEAGHRLLSLRRTLGAVVDALSERVKHNKVFIEKSIENLQAVASHLSSAIAGRADPHPNPRVKRSLVYTDRARVSPSTEQAGSLVEKRF